MGDLRRSARGSPGTAPDRQFGHDCQAVAAAVEGHVATGLGCPLPHRREPYPRQVIFAQPVPVIADGDPQVPVGPSQGTSHDRPPLWRAALVIASTAILY